MKPNRKTQIAIFPAYYTVENATASDHKVHSATDTPATNDSLHITSRPEKRKVDATVTGLAQKTVRSQKAYSSAQTSDIEWSSPWKHYREEFQLHDLGGSLTVAVSQGRQVYIRKIALLESKDALSKFRSLRHRNIVEFIHAYMTDPYMHAVFEPTTILTKPSWVLSLVSYLEAEGFEHPTLDSRSILVTDAGIVKIELCRPLEGHSQHHIDTLLMQKYYKETPGIDDLDRWPPDSDGFAFLVAIDSASSIDELHRDTDCLLGLLSLARVSVFLREYECKA
ncbi:fad-binding domain-containing protein [Colletotrichum incanum]|uniref:Fad-binding domain-containing protein n=1 Tax=Colletotrichum incanum TaxID=1573173 RepID=A0A167AK67_COLIC|nr:fad-binding domain-containing protein [Colletotrichum incanum]